MRSLTVQDIADEIIKPNGSAASTVDAITRGKPDTVVTGIVSTFVATSEVIEQAARLGANLIIAHEGTFYRHQEKENEHLLADDPVYQEKNRLIESAGMAIVRYHDGIHRIAPDGITEGLIRALGWSSYITVQAPAYSVVTLPGATLKDIAVHAKDRLNIPFVRAVGDASMSCSRVGILVGYRGGGSLAIPLYEKEQLDLIIAGEGPEWETPEYVRYAVHQGRRKALLLLGHACSEEAGMSHFTEQLRTRFPSLPVHFIRVSPLFSTL
jgi:putative NIF3 family GTP cyclohydrolase 1 type 2